MSVLLVEVIATIAGLVAEGNHRESAGEAFKPTGDPREIGRRDTLGRN
jgi:hypothetical protein